MTIRPQFTLLMLLLDSHTSTHTHILAGFSTSDLDTEGDGFHDEHSVRKDACHLFYTVEVLHRLPHIPVLIQQLELP